MTQASPPIKRIAIIGGGPSGLFVYKRLVESGHTGIAIDIFEAKTHLGTGMPYSPEGASPEHITNVSGNEIPKLVTPLPEWLHSLPQATLDAFHIDPARFNEFKVLPRLLFGQYLEAQFTLLRQRAATAGLSTTVHLSTRIADIIDHPDANNAAIETETGDRFPFDHIVICTGHVWPKQHEGRVPNYFDSPYPPSKLTGFFNHPVAIRGSSLTAVDAIRTIARQHGEFVTGENGAMNFHPRKDAPAFRITMHSRHGLLPCIRFHIEEPYVGGDDALINEHALATNRAANDGFVSLDFIVDQKFKQPLREKDPDFYAIIKDLTLEQIVAAILDRREQIPPFALFKREYAEAECSIRDHQSIYWKEILAALSFAMNYPAKHMSAEDMRRHKQVLAPLIGVVIAFIPQSSCREMIALHDAGKLDIVDVGYDSHVEPDSAGGCIYHFTCEDGHTISTAYPAYIDSTGQPHLPFEAFPFKSLVQHGRVTPARLKFRDAAIAKKLMADKKEPVEQQGDNYYLRVPGIAITDDFKIVGVDGTANPRIYMMAVPYIGGYNPDYSGLDFCEEASDQIVVSLLSSTT